VPILRVFAKGGIPCEARPPFASAYYLSSRRDLLLSLPLPLALACPSSTRSTSIKTTPDIISTDGGAFAATAERSQSRFCEANLTTHKINNLQNYLTNFPAKSHVKPQNLLTPYPSITSHLRGSFLQYHIIEIEQEKPRFFPGLFLSGSNSFRKTNLAVNPLERRFCRDEII
jgi:hypothetical protein